MSTQRIVIVGGNGFIGSALIDRLLQEGYRDVVNVSRGDSRRNDIVHVRASLADGDAIAEVIREGDIVVHLAGSSTPSAVEEDPAGAAQEEIVGSITLLGICVRLKVRKFIYLSSGGTVYGPADAPAPETSPAEPRNAFGTLKRSIELWVEAFGRRYGMPYAIVRLSNAYGRKDSRGRAQGVVDIFMERLRADQPIVVRGNGSIVRDYIHIDDVCTFLSKVISDDLAGVYNLGTGVGTSINQLLEILERVTGKKPIVAREEGASFDLPYSVLSIEKARNTGWEPRQTLEERIRQFWNNV